MVGVRNLRPTTVTDLGCVCRVHSNNPPTVLAHVVGEPLDESAPIPPAVLHGVLYPTEVFHSDNSVAVKMRKVSYLLRRQDSQLALFTGCRLPLESRLI